MKTLTVLIPSFNRPASLAVLLTSLYYQEFDSFDIVIADQSTPEPLVNDRLVRMTTLLLANKDINTRIVANLPIQGMAQQRQFLLEQCGTPYCLYLDDDLVLEPWVIRNMLSMLRQLECGFVGNAVIGLSFRHDHRPQQQHIEFWEGPVMPENITWGSREWQRYELHNAANILHVQEELRITPEVPRAYKIAWSGGCVMYDREKLTSAGAFRFWEQLPDTHCGEDVMAQWNVMQQYGGCGIIPSGVYHQELPTTLNERHCNAPQYLNPKTYAH